MLQGSWERFESCDDVHVIAGCLKLFLRELPQPLLPHVLHDRLRAAATGHVSFSLLIILLEDNTPHYQGG